MARRGKAVQVTSRMESLKLPVRRQVPGGGAIIGPIGNHFGSMVEREDECGEQGEGEDLEIPLSSTKGRNWKQESLPVWQRRMG